MKIDVAVVDDKDLMMILGEDLYGGNGSKLDVVHWDFRMCFLTLYDEITGVIDNIHFVKNVNSTQLPRPNVVPQVIPKKGQIMM